MKLVYRRCAGLDIHKDSVSVCVRVQGKGKEEEKIEEAVFPTFAQDLEKMAAWLQERRIRQVAMESTGVYWIPIWNILERPKFRFDLILVNPAAVRALQGRKTDRIDARRIAEFLQHGLLPGSFVPPKHVREQRELTRTRVHVQQDRNRVINRIAALLERANIKLGSVASNIVGKSGRMILEMLAADQGGPATQADCALGRLRAKLPELKLALAVETDEAFRWMLSRLLFKLDWLDKEITDLDARFGAISSGQQELIGRLCTIPGVDRITAEILISELGADMTQFPTAAHAASWAGLCPGNAESAGKRFSGKTRKGSRYLRRVLVQSAWGAARTKNCFLAALFRKIAGRRGMKKAAVAVAHRLLVIAYLLIRDGGVYQEKGGDHFDRRDPQRTARKLSKRLERIGYKVTLVRNSPDDFLPKKAPETNIAAAVVPTEVCRRRHDACRTICFHLLKRPGPRKEI